MARPIAQANRGVVDLVSEWWAWYLSHLRSVRAIKNRPVAIRFCYMAQGDGHRQEFGGLL